MGVIVLISLSLIAKHLAWWAGCQALLAFESIGMIAPIRKFGGKRRGRWIQVCLGVPELISHTPIVERSASTQWASGSVIALHIVAISLAWLALPAFGPAVPRTTSNAAQQDTLIVGGPAAWGVRSLAFAFYGSLFYIAPGLFLWPFYLASALWGFFVWRPTWYASAIGMGFIWGE